MDGLLLLLNLLTGGLVGYITNTLAIKMLFKQYPLIGGGEVVKDREHLEDAMSDLVEERLITPETLLEEFDSEAFKLSFEKLIRLIVEEKLREKIAKFDTLHDISGYGQTLSNLRKFLVENRDTILSSALNSLFDHLQVGELLSQAQLRHLLSQLFESFAQVLEKQWEPLLESLMEELEQKPLEEILSSDLAQQLLDQLLKGLHTNFNYLGASWWEKQMNTLYRELNIPQLWEVLESQLRERSLADLLGKDSQRESFQQLVTRIESFLSSATGQQLIAELLKHLVAVLKEVERPLASLLTPRLEEWLLGLIEQYLPALLDHIEGWMNQNHQELNQLIQASIDEHLRQESLVKHLTATVFSEQLTERYKIVENVIQEIRRIANQSKAGMASLATRFLENTRVCDLAQTVDTHWLDYEALTQSLIRILNYYLPRVDAKLLEPWLNRPLESLPGLSQLHLAELANEQLYPYFRKQLIQRIFLNPQLENWLKKASENWISNNKQRSLAVWLPKPRLEALAPWLQKWLHSDAIRKFVMDRLGHLLSQTLASKPISEVIPAAIHDTLWSKLQTVFLRKLDDFLLVLQREKVDTLYSHLAKIYLDLTNYEAFATRTRETIVKFMIELIRDHRLFHGRIRITIKESFARFSDRELEQEMEGFMGQELQPIAWLGAFLGASVGTGMGLGLNLPLLHTYTTGFWALLSFPVVYALTGIGTNWLAIRMLFRPYQAKFLGPLQIPFTPAVFIKNKLALAESMARFIDQKLLAKDNMVEILERYHHRWKDVIKQVVSHNDYQAWDSTLTRYTHENYDTLSPLVLELGFRELHANSQEIASYLVEEARAVELEPEDFQHLRAEFLGQVQESQYPLSNWLKRALERLLVSENSLVNHFSGDFLTLIRQGLQNQIHTWLTKTGQELKQVSHFRSQFLSYGQHWDRFLNTRLASLTPADTLPQETLLSWGLNTLATSSWQDNLLIGLENWLKQGLRSHSSVGEIFDGSLLKWVYQESDFFMDIFSGYLLEMMRNHKSKIVKAVVSDIQRQGVLEVMLVNFGGVRNDVKKVVDVLIEQKLGGFLDSKSSELKAVLKTYIREDIAAIPLSDLGLEDDVFHAESLRQMIKTKILEHPQTLPVLSQFTGALLSELLQTLSFKEVLELVQIDSLEDLYQRFALEFEAAQNHFIPQLSHPKLSANLSEAGWKMIQIQVLERYPGEFFAGIHPLPLKEHIQDWVEMIYQGRAFRKIYLNLLDHFLEPLGEGDITGLIDYRVLETDVSEAIQTLSLQTPAGLARSAPFQKSIRESLKNLTLHFIGLLNQTIEKETKEDVEDLMVDSLIDGLRQHNREVLEPIDFAGIVRREVLAMNPARIESLFEFAQPIFNALTWYGALGGIFGLIVAALAFLG
ncbi:hypothetical protein COW36_09420 [bacterium (Candidatus Blackallbacteria) CG17_big_fil_post_rev_8_21_14_2_50_48_46]|uniref:DUF445 domain-containing protein n=1 Tax=bacterium (Candidatus Blackallbacteria) CG17_big_fil_post_rev_8_21_14_2_50_48_46 TaxID=2014261 RepID=A0A2M7G5D0_9BACT|nr:MAG: hypothetical protein COW64_01990 [bacterium (Candidatus Blackallbacteria) CG18_big_fil_WC_8_21_14_2_50_49_26]PIW17182.1 MAG: hypothetical protein COW36_09420 [bacterium (Candidatus Blackallbacteria) CG17_big_fil_post_rev_8_21_14_2_50_48_46]PIW50973.1 MAG: hypothetical protein COW20_00430 [bacterium (Candidatus Blackallbacteria) CG13_big_fil_rev_8_21_14_2_50_49_14]